MSKKKLWCPNRKNPTLKKQMTKIAKFLWWPFALAAAFSCTDKHERCAFWSKIGECDRNPRYMHSTCAASCGTCGDRCFKQFAKEMKVDAVPPHQLHDIMRLALSREEYVPRLIHDQPPVVYFERFLSDTEADQLVDLGIGSGYQRSCTVGGFDENGSPKTVCNHIRTSTHSFCDQAPCISNNTVLEITSRIANISNVSPENHEYFQMLRYDAGQYYKACLLYTSPSPRDS